MNDNLRKYCLSLPGVTEDMPFDDKTLVFRIGGKMFALTSVPNGTSVNLKGTPENNLSYREQYHSVKPGYHMNKKHWITVEFEGDVPEETLLQWAKDSYALVRYSLTKKIQATLPEFGE